MVGYRWIIIGSMLAFLSVAAGAFAAHALKNDLAEDRLALMETAARYQMFHALALIALGGMGIRSGWANGLPLNGTSQADPTFCGPTAPVLRRLYAASGWCFTLGIVLFSGSLYVLSLGGSRRWALLTPCGGTAFLLGWLCLTGWAWLSLRRGTRWAVDSSAS